MRKLILIVPLLLLFGGTMSFADDSKSYFPLDKGRIWVFDDGNIDQIVSFMRTERGGEAASLFVFDPYNFSKRNFFREGLKVYEWRNNFRRLWYDFGAQPGDTWKMTWTSFGPSPMTMEAPPEELADINDGAEVTLIAVDEKASVPFGDFTGVFHFKIARPGVNDAAYVEEWFASGVGCVQRVWDTIAGPHMQKLAKTVRPEPVTPLRLDVELDKEHYAPGEDIQITVSLLNWSDSDITLDFPNNLQVDYSIDNAYQWSTGRAFTDHTTQVTIPARDIYKWTFTHTAAEYRVPSGKHIVAAEVMGQVLKASRGFTVNQEFPSLPRGIELSLKTDKNRYTPGEPISFTLTVTNETHADITLGIQEGFPIRYWIDLLPAAGTVEPMPPVVEVTVKPGEPLTYTGAINADAGVLESGMHGLFAGLTGYNDMAWAKFLVVPEITLGTVSGTVISLGPSDEKIPVSGAQVSLISEIPYNFSAQMSNMSHAEKIEFTAVTDETGAFSLADVPVGAFYMLTVKKDGYHPHIETIRTLQALTELKVTLYPVGPKPGEMLNVKRHILSGLLISMGTDRSAYLPDSPFTANFSITNTRTDGVTFTFGSETHVDWYLDTPDGSIELTEDTAAKTGASAEFTITLAAGETRTFTRTSTFKDKVPVHGGKYAVRASLRYTSSSITTLKPGDVSDYVKVLVAPFESERFNARGHNKEMVLDLKNAVRAYINITTHKDSVSGEMAVAEILENLHSKDHIGRFVKMIEVDADSTIRADMDSALVRIYFDPAVFGEGFDPRCLVIAHWDDKIDNPKWSDLVSRIDTVNNFVEAWTNSFSSFALFDTGTSTGVDSGKPLSYRLEQNMPNPFNPATSISFRIPSSGRVTLIVYNVAGQKVARLVDGTLQAGAHRVVFDGSRFASGVYFYRLTAPGFAQARKMLLIK
jgi:hypothetical protein